MASNSQIDVLFLGHSFVRRLQNDIDSGKIPNSHTNFGLNQCQVHYVHNGGWSLLPDYNKFLREIEVRIPKATYSGRFKVAVLQIGGNDVDGKVCPLSLASKLDDFVRWLESMYGINNTYICEIFTRPKPRKCTPEEYEKRRNDAMRFLDTMLSDSDSVKIWRHRRIFHSPNNMFLRDGVHLNDSGTKKFYESIKRAIIMVVEEFKRK